MSEGSVEGHSETAVVEPPTGPSAQATTETPSQNGSAASQAQSAPVEESFSNLDPQTLPPEMQAVYKQMQADYTKKTMSVADLRKKADQFDQLAQDKRVVDFVNGLSKEQKADYKEQKAEVEKQLGEIIPDEEFQKLFQTKEGFLELIAKVVEAKSEKTQKKIAELEQYKQVTDASRIVEAFATEQDAEGKPVRPDFYKLDEDGLINGYLRLAVPEGAPSQEYQAKLQEAYRWAKATTQKYFDAGKAEALKIIQAKAATSTHLPTTTAKGAYTGPDPKKITPLEAFEMAKKGIRIPQQYD